MRRRCPGPWDLTERSGDALRNTLQAAETSGLRPGDIEPGVLKYVLVAREASDVGYETAFLGVTVLAVTPAFSRSGSCEGPVQRPGRSVA